MSGFAYKTQSFAARAFKDKANLPLFLANTVGLSLILFFGGRKVLLHPDARFDIYDRSTSEVTPHIVDNSYSFRQSTSAFGHFLRPLTDIIHSVSLAGRGRRDEFWHKAQLETNIPPPLEHSNFFDDGLFKAIEPVAPATGVMVAEDDKEDL